MNGKKKRTWSILKGIDLVLIGMVVALFATGALLLWSSSTWWGYYLSALDVRVWSLWKCIGLAVVLVGSLLVIRHWPNEKH